MRYTSKFFEFFPPPRFLAMPALGIAISDRSLRFTELKKKGTAFSVGRYGEMEIPEGVVRAGQIVDERALRDIFIKLREEQKILFVRLALQEQQGYLVRFKIAKMKKKEIRGTIEMQLEEHVPIAPADAIFDYTEATCGSSGHEHEGDIGVSVMPKAVIFSYLKLFEEAGLIPLSFEIEAQALARALVKPDDCSTYMIVDVGGVRTGLSIVSGGIVRFTWTINVGGEVLTQAVASSFGLNFEDAKKKKEKEGFRHERLRAESSRDMASVLSLQVRLLREEIEKRAVYWETHTDEDTRRSKMEKIIVCGGEANVPGFLEYLGDGLSVPVELGDPWQNILSLEDHIPKISHAESLQYVTALGLAIHIPQ